MTQKQEDTGASLRDRAASLRPQPPAAFSQSGITGARWRFDWRRLLPPYWLQNEPTSWAWDAMLNDLMDKHAPVKRMDMSVWFGPYEVWTENWPYSYGNLYTPYLKLLPSVATRKRLRKLLGQDGPKPRKPSDAERLAAAISKVAESDAP